MVQPIVLGDTTGLGGGIQRAGSALAGVLAQQGQMNQLQKSQQAAQEGERNLLEMILGLGGQGGGGGMGPLGPMGPGMGQGQGQMGPGQGGFGPGQSPFGDVMGQGNPAFANMDASQLSAIAAMQNNPQLAALAQAEIQRRLEGRKNFEKDRDFAFKRTQPFFKELDESRSRISNQSMALGNLKNALANQDLGFFSQDNLANMMGAWGEGFRTMEGAQFQQGVKEFLVEGVGGIGGRPNQWIEQQLSGALPHIGQSNKANHAVVAALEAKLNTDRARIKVADELEQQYLNTLGYVPGDFARIVDREMEKYQEDISGKLSMDLRNLFESDQDLSKLTRTKVPPGTPLTPQMAGALMKEYGSPEDAREAAQQLGYFIPTADQYQRWAVTEFDYSDTYAPEDQGGFSLPSWDDLKPDLSMDNVGKQAQDAGFNVIGGINPLDRLGIKTDPFAIAQGKNPFSWK